MSDGVFSLITATSAIYVRKVIRSCVYQESLPIHQYSEDTILIIKERRNGASTSQKNSILKKLHRFSVQVLHFSELYSETQDQEMKLPLLESVV